MSSVPFFKEGEILKSMYTGSTKKASVLSLDKVNFWREWTRVRKMASVLSFNTVRVWTKWTLGKTISVLSFKKWAFQAKRRCWKMASVGYNWRALCLPTRWGFEGIYTGLKNDARLKKYTLASKMTSVSFLQHGKNLQRLGTGTNKWWAFCRSTGWEFEENRHWNKWKAFYLSPPPKKKTNKKWRK